MLKIWRRSVRVQRSNERVAILHGNNDAIDGVMRQRRDYGFRQNYNFPKVYFVKVRYVVADDGFINIQAVWVSADQHSWSCFYNPADGQEGERSVCRNRFSFYYLTSEDVDGIYEVFECYEDDQASARLANEGPSAFEFIDELAEDIFKDDIQTLVRGSRLFAR